MLFHLILHYFVVFYSISMSFSFKTKLAHLNKIMLKATINNIIANLFKISEEHCLLVTTFMKDYPLSHQHL